MYLFRDCPIHCSSRRSVRGVSPPNKAPFPRNQSVQRSLSSVVTWSAHQPLSHSWNLVFLRANTSGLTWSGVRECVCMWVTWIIINSMYMYCIAVSWGKIFVVFVVEGLTTNIYPRMKRPCLPLFAVQAATKKILPTKRLNIAKPQIFCPPKMTRYIYGITIVLHNLASLHSIIDFVHVYTKTHLSSSVQGVLVVEIVLTVGQWDHSIRLFVHFKLNGSTGLHVGQDREDDFFLGNQRRHGALA